MSRNPIDGRVHFSELKAMSKSPRHYLHAIAEARSVTRPMTVGAVADSLVFGQRIPTVYPGTRRGKEWEAFKRAAPPEAIICIQSELDDATGAAEAVKADPIAKTMLGAKDVRVQVCAAWESFGLPRATGIEGERGGFDLIGTTTPEMVKALSEPMVLTGERFVADLKITASTEPFLFAKHAWRMLWHAQLADYSDALAAIGDPVRHAFLMGVEPAPPHNVTILRVSEAAIESGRKSLSLWAEQVRACEASGIWPGYVQRCETLHVPEWDRDEETVEDE